MWFGWERTRLGRSYTEFKRQKVCFVIIWWFHFDFHIFCHFCSILLGLIFFVTFDYQELSLLSPLHLLFTSPHFIFYARKGINTHTQIYIYTYTNTHTQIHIHKYKYTNTSTQIHVHKYTYTNIHIQINVHKYTFFLFIFSTQYFCLFHLHSSSNYFYRRGHKAGVECLAYDGLTTLLSGSERGRDILDRKNGRNMILFEEFC